MSLNPKQEKYGGSRPPINVIDLKPGMENVTVRVRVLDVGETRSIETKKGTRTISNAVIGDSSGRVEATLWGDKAGSLKTGDVVEINGAWISEFKGKVQLNIGKNTNIIPLPSESLPEHIPETRPRGTGRSQVGREPPRRGHLRRKSIEE